MRNSIYITLFLCCYLAANAQKRIETINLKQGKQQSSNDALSVKSKLKQNNLNAESGSHVLISYQAKTQANKKQLISNEMKVFPNPTEGLLQINFKKESSGTISIFDMQGKLIFTSSMVNQMQHQIDLPQHYQGIFALVFQNGQEKLVAKFVKR